MVETGSAGIIDTHVHLFDPDRFPYTSMDPYKPQANETAPVNQLIEVMDCHGVSHAVLVTPSVGYGPDNRAVLDAIEKHPGRFRGIGVLHPETSDTEIKNLKALGMVGFRIDLLPQGASLLAKEGRRLLQLLADNGMLLQVQSEGPLLSNFAEQLCQWSGPLIIDHMGRPDVNMAHDQPAFTSVLDLAERAQTYIKLSGPFRLPNALPPYAEVDAFAETLVARFGAERCVWGSDWPFVKMNRRLDYGPTIHILKRWLPDDRARQQVLRETAFRLYGFDKPVGVTA